MNHRIELDFVSIVDDLPVPKPTRGGLAFTVATPPAIVPVRLGKSTAGEPSVLIPSSKRASQRPPIELRHLSVLFGARCHVSGDVEEEAYFTVVRCRGDLALQGYFLLIAKTLLLAAGPNADESSVEKSVLALVELFRSVAKPPAYALRGLWGELLLMARSADPVTVLRAWHVAAIERFDFGAGTQRVEVKTAGRSTRRHHFSLDQLVASDLAVCVASLQIEPAAAGQSLMELVDAVSARLDQVDDVVRLTTTVGSVLGTDWADYATARFDDVLAASSIQFFRAEAVPRVRLPLPEPVTQVEFVADLGGIEVLSEADMAAARGLWRAIRPR